MLCWIYLFRVFGTFLVCKCCGISQIFVNADISVKLGSQQDFQAIAAASRSHFFDALQSLIAGRILSFVKWASLEYILGSAGPQPLRISQNGNGCLKLAHRSVISKAYDFPALCLFYTRLDLHKRIYLFFHSTTCTLMGFLAILFTDPTVIPEGNLQLPLCLNMCFDSLTGNGMWTYTYLIFTL